MFLVALNATCTHVAEGNSPFHRWPPVMVYFACSVNPAVLRLGNAPPATKLLSIVSQCTTTTASTKEDPSIS